MKSTEELLMEMSVLVPFPSNVEIAVSGSGSFYCNLPNVDYKIDAYFLRSPVCHCSTIAQTIRETHKLLATAHVVIVNAWKGENRKKFVYKDGSFVSLS